MTGVHGDPSSHNEKILVTGAAGFIGFHVALRLLQAGRQVVGIDSLNDYYDVGLKEARLEQLGNFSDFSFIKQDVADKDGLAAVNAAHGPFREIVHLAAQAGVRHSLKDPYSYVTANLMGHLAILELCRHTPGFRHLVYASSSSVYGGNEKLPYAVTDDVSHPVSLYAATKRGGELMSESYSHLYAIPQTGLRFFTVYGPWGRPDMALHIFTRAILAGEKVPVFNNGAMKRDFTYIDDIVDGVLASLAHPPAEGDHRVLNLGNTRSEKLMDVIGLIEKTLGRKAAIDFLPMQPGDVCETYADIKETTEAIGYKPVTSIESGIPRFVDWYRAYYKS